MNYVVECLVRNANTVVTGSDPRDAHLIQVQNVVRRYLMDSQQNFVPSAF